MSDAPASDAPPATPETPEPGAAPDQPTDPTALKTALDKERKARRDAERRAKDLEPFERQAKEAADAAKSETQKLNEALEAERLSRTSAETELLRFRVASEKNVPLNLVRFLSGSTKEEVAESAELLLKELNARPSMPGRPQERLVHGGRASDTSASEDPRELIKRARSQG